MATTHHTQHLFLFQGSRSSAERDEASAGLPNPDPAPNPVLTSSGQLPDPKDWSITDEEKELMRLAAQAKLEGAKGMMTISYILASKSPPTVVNLPIEISSFR